MLAFSEELHSLHNHYTPWLGNITDVTAVTTAGAF